jgi:carbon monoxide dehydrogenase subunit G
MKVRGNRTLQVPRDAVFAAILDPEILLGVIPGCRAVERVDETEYHATIALRLPGMVGTWRTVVRVVESDPPSSGEIAGALTGALGSITGRAAFRLSDDDGRTTVDYEGSAVIGGPLARLDSRFVEGLAGSLISQGLGNLEARLRETARAGA